MSEKDKFELTQQEKLIEFLGYLVPALLLIALFAKIVIF